MLIHPYLQRRSLQVHPGTRVLSETLGIVGAGIINPADPERMWEIRELYAPIPSRALGGIRARLVDEKNFVTFLNQMDLEVLLHLGTPGKFCTWARRNYAAPGDREWCGFCVDEEDLLDDLQARELHLRTAFSYQPLPAGLEINRFIHAEEGRDLREYLLLRGDVDFATGLSPDARLETISQRWVRVEMENAPWETIFTP